MGQVFSYIWSCLRQKLRHDTPNTTNHDHIAQQQQHQTYYIPIPDADIYQIPSLKPPRLTLTRTIPRDFTPPVPTLVLDFNSNSAFQNKRRIANKEEKEYCRKEVIPQQQQSHYIDIPDVHTHHFVVPKPICLTSTISLPSVVLDLHNNVHQKVAKDKKKEYCGEEALPPVVEKQIIVKQEAIKKLLSVSKKPLVKRIGPYTSEQKILLVGEGDFSFSASLAVAFDSASNITATSLNPEKYLIANYRQFMTNKIKLESRGGTVIHDIDVTTMFKDHVLARFKFGRIIYNFPHTGLFAIYDLRINQELIRGFFRNAKEMIYEDGEIHITHKCNSFFLKWDIPKIGSDEGLHLIEAVKFKRTKYSGYHTKYGFRGDDDFNCNPCKTYKFGLVIN